MKKAKPKKPRKPKSAHRTWDRLPTDPRTPAAGMAMCEAMEKRP